MNKKIKVALVDDHQIVIDGISALLNNNENIVLTFTSTQPETVIDLLKHYPTDILITDIVMPNLSGNELSRMVKQNYPEVRILTLSMNGEIDLVTEMINESDIAGYALKNISQQDLIQAIETIASGDFYFCKEIIEGLHSDKKRKEKNEQIHLTAREIEIIKLIEKELTNKQIAERLHISERTVETHRKNIFRKTNTNSILGIVKYAYEQKLL